MIKTKTFITLQLAFILIVGIGIYILYPKVSLSISGNNIKIDSINTNEIIISKSPDFTNARRIPLDKENSITLKPGTYYWRPVNGIMEGISGKFVINSEVGLALNNNTLENVGNVKINVTKTKEGNFIGHIILEPDESKKVNDEKIDYKGRGIE